MLRSWKQRNKRVVNWRYLRFDRPVCSGRISCTYNAILYHFVVAGVMSCRQTVHLYKDELWGNVCGEKGPFHIVTVHHIQSVKPVYDGQPRQTENGHFRQVAFIKRFWFDFIVHPTLHVWHIELYDKDTL